MTLPRSSGEVAPRSSTDIVTIVNDCVTPVSNSRPTVAPNHLVCDTRIIDACHPIDAVSMTLPGLLMLEIPAMVMEPTKPPMAYAPRSWPSPAGSVPRTS